MFGFDNYSEECDFQKKRAERLQRENDSLRQKLHKADTIANAREWFPDGYLMTHIVDELLLELGTEMDRTNQRIRKTGLPANDLVQGYLKGLSEEYKAISNEIVAVWGLSGHFVFHRSSPTSDMKDRAYQVICQGWTSLQRAWGQFPDCTNEFERGEREGHLFAINASRYLLCQAGIYNQSLTQSMTTQKK